MIERQKRDKNKLRQYQIIDNQVYKVEDEPKFALEVESVSSNSLEKKILFHGKGYSPFLLDVLH